MAISNPGALDVTRGEGASLIEIAHALEPLIRAHAEALDDRRIPAPLVEALYDAGVFRSMLPREVGGLEVEPVEWLQMIEELARINASVGWLAFINSGVGLTFLDPARFERFRLRGGGRLILAMSLGRMAGKAVKVEGGYRISGRWPFASGSPFATWLGVDVGRLRKRRRCTHRRPQRSAAAPAARDMAGRPGTPLIDAWDRPRPALGTGRPA